MAFHEGGFDSDLFSFGDLLKLKGQRLLVVPNYQRPYEWETEHLDTLILDLLDHYDTWKEKDQASQSNYFTGTVVIHDDPKARYIVDGQQRITTITVILCALRDIIDAAKSEVQSETIDSTDLLKYPMDQKTGMSVSQLKNMITGLISDGNVGVGNRPILELKQADEERLKWIRLTWQEKQASLCPNTFAYWKKQGSTGLPGQEGGRLRSIYENYLQVWKHFGHYSPDEYKEISNDSHRIFSKLGVLEIKQVSNDDQTSDLQLQHPFNNEKMDKLPKLTSREWVDCIPTLQRISDLVSTIMDIAKVLELTVSEQWMAHVIFDRANTAGKKLAMIDVVRAKSFASLSKCNGNKEDEKRLHSSMDGIYELKPNPVVVTNFVKHFATMTKGEKITGAGIKYFYDNKFQSIGSDKEKLWDFVDSFVDSFSKYQQILAEPDLSLESSWMKAYSEDFNKTSFKQHRPIVLKALTTEGVTPEKQMELQRCVESIYIIHRLLMTGSPSEIETMMADHVSTIVDDDSVDTAMKKLISDFKKTNTFNQLKATPFTLESYRTRFSETVISRTQQAHFILRNKFRSDMKVDISEGPPKIKNSTFANVEHILPEKPKKWGEPWYVDGKTTSEHDLYVYRLGNMTLFNHLDNKKVSNDTFDNKKEQYKKKNNPTMTRKLNEYEKWGAEEIDSRTDELLDYVVETWWTPFYEGIPQEEE